MRGFFCAGNWKMNKGPDEAREFIHALRAQVGAEDGASFVIFPQALAAFAVAEELKSSAIAWGAQNCFYETKGAFTGENSPAVLKQMGAKYCLVGHSERRHIFGEVDEVLAKKVKAVQEQGMTPVLCVGETADDRSWNRTEEVIRRQTRQGFEFADPRQPLWLAYEPVWAIGTGQVATPDQVEEAHTILRRTLHEWNGTAAEQIPILYGGSVKADNVKALAPLKNVDGFLIGGASLIADELFKIHRLSLEARQ